MDYQMLHILTNLNPYPWPVTEQVKPWSIEIIIMFVIFLVSVFPLSYYFGKKSQASRKTEIIFLISVGGFLVLTEIYKQLLYTYHYNREYHFDIFPFQLCATPMYISILIPMVKKEKIRNCLYSFLAFYGMIGGVSVTLYQQSVLTWEDYFLDYHSIIWHFLLVALGIFAAAHLKLGENNYQANMKKLLQGTYVFIIVVLIAEMLNLLIILNYGYNDYTNGGNLFYISMFMINLDITILRFVTSRFGWYVGLVGYVVTLILAAYLISLFYMLLGKAIRAGKQYIIDYKKKKSTSKNSDI